MPRATKNKPIELQPLSGKPGMDFSDHTPIITPANDTASVRVPEPIGQKPVEKKLHMRTSEPTINQSAPPPVFLQPLPRKRYGDHRHMVVIDGERVSPQSLRVLDSEELFMQETSGQSGPGNNGEIDVVQTTELGDSLKELNQDQIQKGTRMSGIDMRANLHYAEIASILGVDTLVAFKFLPINALQFTRQKKRLSASLAGRGRQQIVEIVGGKQAQDAAKSGGLFDKMRGLVGGNEQK